MSAFLPPLPESWEATRATLHAYAHGVGAVPREHAVPHPKWWHISLNVVPRGLVTNSMPLSDGGTFHIAMDLLDHAVVVESSAGDRIAIPMTGGATGTQMGERIIDEVGAVGMSGEYDRQKFENDDVREYDVAAVGAFHEALVNVHQVFTEHQAGIEPVGPVQLWPHGFDLAVEWFGTRMETYVEDGKTTAHPSQLNLGFYPGGRPYFYSNPWPFDEEALLGVELPHGAQWHTEGWEGSILYYDQLAGDPEARRKLLEYARTVHATAAPTLTA